MEYRQLQPEFQRFVGYRVLHAARDCAAGGRGRSERPRLGGPRVRLQPDLPDGGHGGFAAVPEPARVGRLHDDVDTQQGQPRAGHPAQTAGNHAGRIETSALVRLSTFEYQVNRLSSGRLFANAKTYSQTRGLKIHQVFRKTESLNRFDTMYLVAEYPNDRSDGDYSYICLNPDAPENPWGGNGMPLGLLHGHQRPEALWGIGDSKMLKDDQDHLNVVNLYRMRQLKQASKEKWIVDRKAYGSDNTPEAIAELHERRQRDHHVRLGPLEQRGPCAATREHPPTRSVPQRRDEPDHREHARAGPPRRDPSGRGQTHTRSARTSWRSRRPVSPPTAGCSTTSCRARTGGFC